MLSDLEPELTAWSKKNLKNRLEKLDIYPIHHVSLGVDADDKNYVTVYFKLCLCLMTKNTPLLSQTLSIGKSL